MAGTVKFRLKSKFADGREQTYTNRSGSTGTSVRITVGTVFEDESGKMNMSFEDNIKAAIIKALGGSPDDRVYFDLYENDGGIPATKPAKPAARDDW